MIERKLSAVFVLALAVQTGTILVWAGAAGQRLSALEVDAESYRPMTERLARVEAQLDLVRGQLDRIESKVEAE